MSDDGYTLINDTNIKYKINDTISNGNCFYDALYYLIKNNPNIGIIYEDTTNPIEYLRRLIYFAFNEDKNNVNYNDFMKKYLDELLNVWMDGELKKDNDLFKDAIQFKDTYPEIQTQIEKIGDITLDTLKNRSLLLKNLQQRIMIDKLWASQLEYSYYEYFLGRYNCILININDYTNENMISQICTKIGSFIDINNNGKNNHLKNNNPQNKPNENTRLLCLDYSKINILDKDGKETIFNANHYKYISFYIHGTQTTFPKYIDFYNLLSNKYNCPEPSKEIISPFALAAATSFSIKDPILTLVQSMIDTVSNVLNKTPRPIITPHSSLLGKPLSTILEGSIEGNLSTVNKSSSMSQKTSSPLIPLLQTTNTVLTQIASTNPSLKDVITRLQLKINKITSNPSIVTIEYLSNDFLPPLIAFLQSIPSKGGKKKGFKEHRRKYIK